MIGGTTMQHPTADALRVLVVEDSAPQRAMLVQLLNSDPELRVVGWAASGAEGVQEAARLRPDVITMDLLMPAMDGLEASRLIMQKTPTPIVMVTATPAPKDQAMAAEAFRAGILALAAKPGLDAGLSLPNDLVETVKGMARLKVIRRLPEERLARRARPLAPILAVAPAAEPEIVVIGASTGGPQALQQILSSLPATFPLPILAVQHIASGFAGALVEWLRPQCRLPVDLAYEGLRLGSASVSFAPSERHMIVKNRVIHFEDGPPVCGHRPSVTVLFESVATEFAGAAIGIILTGMADDGALGLRALKERGAITFAQDERSSVVFGMPAAAIEVGAVDHVLPPLEIAERLLELVRTDDDD